VLPVPARATSGCRCCHWRLVCVATSTRRWLGGRWGLEWVGPTSARLRATPRAHRQSAASVLTLG